MRENEASLQQILSRRDVACPSCGYNLRGLAEGVCPECGFVFDLSWLESEAEVFPVRWSAVAGSTPVVIASSVASGVLHFLLAPSPGFVLVLVGWIGLGWTVVLRGLMDLDRWGMRHWLAGVVHLGLAVSVLAVVRRAIAGW